MPRNLESRIPPKEPVRIKMEDLPNRYPNQRVALEVTEITPGIGLTEGIVIAHGSKRAEKKVLSKLKEWMAKNPGKEVGLFYTGHYVKPGEDVIPSVFF